MSKLELISFPLCPFVQRAVIALEEKQAPYDLTFIDLANKPDWFLTISPAGKVPILRVDGDVLFESAAITEYLDETHPPQLMPADPLLRAKQRAWVEYASTVLFEMMGVMMALDEDEQNAKADIVRQKLPPLAKEVKDGPFFAGDQFTLADAAWAPVFVRMALIHKLGGPDILADHPGLQKWSSALRNRPAVQNSLVPDFEERFTKMLKSRGSLLVA